MIMRFPLLTTLAILLATVINGFPQNEPVPGKKNDPMYDPEKEVLPLAQKLIKEDTYVYKLKMVEKAAELYELNWKDMVYTTKHGQKLTLSIGMSLAQGDYIHHPATDEARQKLISPVGLGTMVRYPDNNNHFDDFSYAFRDIKDLRLVVRAAERFKNWCQIAKANGVKAVKKPLIDDSFTDGYPSYSGPAQLYFVVEDGNCYFVLTQNGKDESPRLVLHIEDIDSVVTFFTNAIDRNEYFVREALKYVKEARLNNEEAGELFK